MVVVGTMKPSLFQTVVKITVYTEDNNSRNDGQFVFVQNYMLDLILSM